MGYILNEDQKSLVAMAHDFCEKEIKPYAAQWDRDGVFPLESYKKAMEIGYHCLEIPEEYGGGGIDYVTVAAVMEEFAKYDLGFATTLMGTTLSLKPVLMHGTPEQKKMYADVIVVSFSKQEFKMQYCRNCCLNRECSKWETTVAHPCWDRMNKVFKKIKGVSPSEYVLL